MGDYVSVIVYIICAIALLNLLFAIAKDDWVRSRLIRWAVLNNKVEALRLLVGCEDAYAIMSALRGSDSGNLELKWIFSARIRYLVGMSSRAWSPYFRRERTVKLGDVLKALDKVSNIDYHYLNHVEYAIMSLKMWGLIDKDEYELLYNLATILNEVAEGSMERKAAEKNIRNLTNKFRNMVVGGD